MASNPDDHSAAGTADRLTAVTLWVDGTERQLEVDPRTSLLDALRERLGVTSAKKGCDHGQCGACTVLLDGRRVNSCLVLAVAHDGAVVTTAAGLADGDELHPLQRSFIEHDAFQCGYRTPGEIVSAIGMLQEAEQGWPSAVKVPVLDMDRANDFWDSEAALPQRA